MIDDKKGFGLFGGKNSNQNSSDNFAFGSDDDLPDYLRAQPDTNESKQANNFSANSAHSNTRQQGMPQGQSHGQRTNTQGNQSRSVNPQVRPQGNKTQQPSHEQPQARQGMPQGQNARSAPGQANSQRPVTQQSQGQMPNMQPPQGQPQVRQGMPQGQGQRPVNSQHPVNPQVRPQGNTTQQPSHEQPQARQGMPQGQNARSAPEQVNSQRPVTQQSQGQMPNMQPPQGQPQVRQGMPQGQGQRPVNPQHPVNPQVRPQGNTTQQPSQGQPQTRQGMPQGQSQRSVNPQMRPQGSTIQQPSQGQPQTRQTVPQPQAQGQTAPRQRVPQGQGQRPVNPQVRPQGSTTQQPSQGQPQTRQTVPQPQTQGQGQRPVTPQMRPQGSMPHSQQQPQVRQGMPQGQRPMNSQRPVNPQIRPQEGMSQPQGQPPQQRQPVSQSQTQGQTAPIQRVPQGQGTFPVNEANPERSLNSQMTSQEPSNGIQPSKEQSIPPYSSQRHVSQTDKNDNTYNKPVASKTNTDDAFEALLNSVQSPNESNDTSKTPQNEYDDIFAAFDDVNSTNSEKSKDDDIFATLGVSSQGTHLEDDSLNEAASIEDEKISSGKALEEDIDNMVESSVEPGLEYKEPLSDEDEEEFSEEQKKSKKKKGKKDKKTSKKQKKEKNSDDKPSSGKKVWKIVLIVFLSLIFIAGATVGGIYGYNYYKETKTTVYYPKEKIGNEFLELSVDDVSVYSSIADLKAPSGYYYVAVTFTYTNTSSQNLEWEEYFPMTSLKNYGEIDANDASVATGYYQTNLEADKAHQKAVDTIIYKSNATVTKYKAWRKENATELEKAKESGDYSYFVPNTVYTTVSTRALPRHSSASYNRDWEATSYFALAHGIDTTNIKEALAPGASHTDVDVYKVSIADMRKYDIRLTFDTINAQVYCNLAELLNSSSGTTENSEELYQ